MLFDTNSNHSHKIIKKTDIFTSSEEVKALNRVFQYLHDNYFYICLTYSLIKYMHHY